MVYENQEELYLATPDSGLPCSLTFFHAKNCRHLEAPSLFLQPLLTNTKKFEKPQGKTEDVAHLILCHPYFYGPQNSFSKVEYM